MSGKSQRLQVPMIRTYNKKMRKRMIKTRRMKNKEMT